jgi:hypothetical protein
MPLRRSYCIYDANKSFNFSVSFEHLVTIEKTQVVVKNNERELVSKILIGSNSKLNL